MILKMIEFCMSSYSGGFTISIGQEIVPEDIWTHSYGFTRRVPPVVTNFVVTVVVTNILNDIVVTMSVISSTI